MDELFKKIFGDSKTWIIIKEGKIGLEYYCDPRIKELSKPNKSIILSFLYSITEELQESLKK